jgi:cardiolipin synthase
VGASISGFEPIGGNHGRLMADSDAAIDAMVSDIDAARGTVHLVFYIWLTDTNGLKIVEALKRAAGRGVTVRAMADDLGSRALIRSEHWLAMEAAGVRLARALPIDNVATQLLRQRIDLRNHRKIVVIDNWITYCGSQNAADAAFSPKPRFAPWVDVMVRFEGPIARQNQLLFAGDWLGHVHDDLSEVLDAPLEAPARGFPAQVIAAGPTLRISAMPEIFEALMYAAERHLVITTPYFVPDEPLFSALCAAGRRGVDTRLIVPERNDSWIVAAASRSYYADLLAAGVRIFEYRDGLLHAKLLTLDGEVSLLGSANIDRRSFQLNYENNVLLYDPGLTADLRARQEDYLARSREVLLDEVLHWSRHRKIWNNAIAMFGPVL